MSVPKLQNRRISLGVKIVALLSSPLVLAIAIAFLEHILGNLKRRYRHDPHEHDEYFDRY